MILFWIKGLLLSRHTPEFLAFLGFLICVRENAPPSHSKRTQAIPAGVRGGCGTKYDFRALRLRIEAIISSYTMDFTSIFKGRFSSGRKAVRQTPCRIHSGRQIGWKKAVCQACVYLQNRCVSHTQDSAKQADFSPVCGCFPCVRCIHKKINISATKGVVFVSGEPWVGSP